jgi:hypothetical protein
MSMISSKVLIRGAVAALAMMAVPAFAGPWSNPAGASDSFSYANGGDINGNFGDPFVSADTFFFINANFQVNAANGTTDSESDTVSFDVTADPGLVFSLIRVTAFGSYAATGPGQNSVDIDGSLSLTENGGLNRNWIGPLNTNPTFPKSDEQGGWSGLAVVDITFEFPVPHNELHVAMANDVVAITGTGGSAEMNVQFQDLKIEFIVIPEPASLSVLALGALALVRRRR